MGRTSVTDVAAVTRLAEQGFRDGYRGWVLCRLLAGYEWMIVTKERELKKRA